MRGRRCHAALCQPRAHHTRASPPSVPADTILSWSEPETGVDFALSFQEPDGCTEVWEQICAIQGRAKEEAQNEPNVGYGPGGGANSGQLGDGGDGAGVVGSAQGEPTLPACEMRNLGVIADLLGEVPIMRRAKVAELLLARDYIPQLVVLFGTAEDLESAEDLAHLFAIFKGLVMLNNTNVYEVLLRDEMLLGVVGALEYDPELRCHEVRHRHFLRDVACFRQVVPFSDPIVVKKVKQNFHLGFLKDVVLPRALDDNTFAALNQLQFYNNVNIISSLTQDGDFFDELRRKLWPDEFAGTQADADELLLALRLLQELCNVTKTLQLYHRAAFYRNVVDHGFFDALAFSLEQPQAALRLAAIDVLLLSTLHDPSLLRHHVLQNRPHAARMLPALLHVLTTGDASGEKPQATEVLRALLDPEGMEGREQDDFLNLFYEKHVHELASPVVGTAHAGTGPMNGTASAVRAAPPADGSKGGSEVGPSAPAADAAPQGAAPSSSSAVAAAASSGASSSSAGAALEDLDGVLSARQYVCELLCFCVAKHSYRIKYFILRNNILVKVLKLASHRDKCLVLAALRFFRTCVGLKDEFYNRYIVKNKCFEPVIAQLLLHQLRDNLIHSAILELFEFIRKENVKSLVAHLMDAYASQITPLTHVDIFKGLLMRHEQNEEFRRISGPPGGLVASIQMNAASGGITVGGGGAVHGVRRAPPNYGGGGRRAFPDEEEDSAYFNASDDDDDDEESEVSVPYDLPYDQAGGQMRYEPKQAPPGGADGAFRAAPSAGLRPDGGMYGSVGDAPLSAWEAGLVAPSLPSASGGLGAMPLHLAAQGGVTAHGGAAGAHEQQPPPPPQAGGGAAAALSTADGSADGGAASGGDKENAAASALPPPSVSLVPGSPTAVHSPGHSPGARLPTSPSGGLSPGGTPRPPTPPMGQASSSLPALLADYADGESPAANGPKGGAADDEAPAEAAAKRQRTEEGTAPPPADRLEAR